MPEIATIALSRPVQVHGETVSELTFREPLGRDMINARMGSHDADEYDQRLIAACCDVPPSVIFNMPMRDVTRLMRQMNRFLGSAAAEAPPQSSTDTTNAPGSGETSTT